LRSGSIEGILSIGDRQEPLVGAQEPTATHYGLVFGLDNGRDTCPVVSPLENVGLTLAEYCPLYAKWLKQSFHASNTSPEFTCEMTTNSLGLRGPRIHLPPRPCILLLGNSFAFGYGVNDGEEFSALFSRMLAHGNTSNYPTLINVGIPGSGDGRWLKFLRREAPEYNPCLVVLQVMENDFDDNLTDKLFAVGDHGSLRPLPVPPPGLMRRLQTLLESIPLLPRSHLFCLFRKALFLIRDRFAHEWRLVESASAETAGQAGDELTYAILKEVLNTRREESWPGTSLLVELDPNRRRRLLDLFSREHTPTVTFPDRGTRSDPHTIDTNFTGIQPLLLHSCC
jgi:hypothetical protein